MQNSKSVLEEIKSMKINELDLKLGSEDLKQILLRIPEYLRIKNMSYFEALRKMKDLKRRLKEVDGNIVLGLDSREFKNKEMREAALFTHSDHLRVQELLDNAEIEVERLRENYWIHKSLESNLKSLAELRTQELKSLGV